MQQRGTHRQHGKKKNTHTPSAAATAADGAKLPPPALRAVDSSSIASSERSADTDMECPVYDDATLRTQSSSLDTLSPASRAAPDCIHNTVA